MNILVTGASGFVGLALCKALVRQGDHVRAAVRAETRLAGLPDSVERIAIGELGPLTNWTSGLKDVHVVVHLAARAHVDARLEGGATSIDTINHLATAELGRQAAAAGVRRFVFMSSIKVNGETTSRPFTGNDTPAPVDSYGIAKHKAEQALLRIEGGMERVILRPPLVHGPDAKGNLLRLMRVIDRGLPLPLASIDNRRSLIGIDNLVSAISLCVSHPAAAGRTYLLSDGDDVSTPQLIRLLAKGMNRPARLVPFPVSLLRLAADLSGRSEIGDRLIASLQVDSDAIRRELGWQPGLTLEQGLTLMARWYDSHSAPAKS